MYKLKKLSKHWCRELKAKRFIKHAVKPYGGGGGGLVQGKGRGYIDLEKGAPLPHPKENTYNSLPLNLNSNYPTSVGIGFHTFMQPFKSDAVLFFGRTINYLSRICKFYNKRSVYFHLAAFKTLNLNTILDIPYWFFIIIGKNNYDNVAFKSMNSRSQFNCVV